MKQSKISQFWKKINKASKSFENKRLPKQHAAAAAKSFQSCPTLCDPIDSSLLGSSVPGILQARVLEWAAISFSCFTGQLILQQEKHFNLSSYDLDLDFSRKSIGDLVDIILAFTET